METCNAPTVGRGRRVFPPVEVRLWENQSQKYMMTGHEIAINAVAGLRKHCFDVEMLDLRWSFFCAQH